MYFWITSGEDGTSICPMTEKQLKGQIKSMIEDGQEVTFLGDVPESDKGSWYADEGAVLVIKGEIVVPKPKTVVTEYELE